MPLPGRYTFQAFLRAMTEEDFDLVAIYKPLKDTHVVITGKLDEGVARETFVRWMNEWGASVDSVVRPSTDWLLAVDPDRMTSKRKDAARYGITVLDEYGFTKMLHDALERTEHEAAALSGYVGTAPVPPPVWFADDPDLLPDGEDQDDPDFQDDIAPLSDLGA